MFNKKLNAMYYQKIAASKGSKLDMYEFKEAYAIFLASGFTNLIEWWVVQERCDLMAAYGAELVLTPAGGAMIGAEAKAVELLAANPKAVRLSQFENGGNPLKHYETAAKEIIADFRKYQCS